MNKKLLVCALLALCAAAVFAKDSEKLLGGWSSAGATGAADLGFFADGTMFMGEYFGEYTVEGDSLKFSLVYMPDWERLDIKFKVSDGLLMIYYKNFQGRWIVKSYVRVAK